jgi:hypothetical protein
MSEVDEFVEDGNDPDARPGAPRKTSRAPDRRGRIRVKADGTKLDHISAWVDIKVVRKARAFCERHRREIGGVVEVALIDFFRALRSGSGPV